VGRVGLWGEEVAESMRRGCDASKAATAVTACVADKDARTREVAHRDRLSVCPVLLLLSAMSLRLCLVVGRSVGRVEIMI
jgi:hypothetical protein